MDKQQQEVDDLSDWLDDANRTVFAESEWDDTREYEVSDLIIIVGDDESLRTWRHDTGQ